MVHSKQNISACTAINPEYTLYVNSTGSNGVCVCVCVCVQDRAPAKWIPNQEYNLWMVNHVNDYK